MKNVVCIFLANGFEEIEGLTVVDMLRRSGIETLTVSVTGQHMVCGAHKIEVVADRLFEEMDYRDAAMLVLPGGMPGTVNLEAHGGLEQLLYTFDKEEKYIAAICAAPGILGRRDMLQGRRAVSYPTKEKELLGAEVLQIPAVVDGHIITGRGVGTAIAFSLTIIELLVGAEKAEEIRRAIVYDQ